MKPEPDLGQGAPFLALTPPGALYAFGCPKPDDGQTELQTLLAQPALPRWADWCDQAPHRAGLLTRALAEGWVQTLERGLSAPNVRLDDFLSHVIGSLSGLRKAALACGGGFCVGHTGYTPHEAETLCAAAADFSEFGRRQQQRGWQGASHMASFHEDIAMLTPTTSFIPFWIDDTDYCLVLAGEPLINNPVWVELIWGIKTSGRRFSDSGRL